MIDDGRRLDDLQRTLVAAAALGLAATLARPADRAALGALLRPRAGPASAAPALTPSRTVQTAEAPLPPRWVSRPQARGEAIPYLEDPCLDAGCARRALDEFARRVGREPAVTRVLHLGDSIVADDRITGRLRRRLQREFGDGGLGFVFLRPTARSYHPAGVRFDGRGWASGSVVGPRWSDGRYGLGGTGFEAADEGPRATLRFDRGRRFEVLVDPTGGGGDLAVGLDEDPVARRSTRGAIAPLLATRDGEHVVTVRAAGGRARVFGVVALRDGPGVTVENLGTVSNSVRSMLSADGPRWTAALREADPALVVLSFGTNEASHGVLPPGERAALESDARSLYRLVREGLVRGSCLVVSPLDSAATIDGVVRPRPALPHILRAQAAAARAEGCAFFDAYRWMGGRGAVQRWRDLGLADGDLTHLTDAGGARLGDVLADALLRARDQRATVSP